MTPTSTQPLYTIATANMQSKLKDTNPLILNKLIKYNIDICGIQDTGPHVTEFLFKNAGYKIYYRPPPLKINAEA